MPPPTTSPIRKLLSDFFLLYPPKKHPHHNTNPPPPPVVARARPRTSFFPTAFSITSTARCNSSVAQPRTISQRPSLFVLSNSLSPSCPTIHTILSLCTLVVSFRHRSKQLLSPNPHPTPNPIRNKPPNPSNQPPPPINNHNSLLMLNSLNNIFRNFPRLH